MKGIILAGGTGSRLYPTSKAISKQLIPVYDKPLIYYPLSVLMLAGIKEILLITTADHVDLFKKLLGSGELLGLDISYMVQERPEGLAQAFVIGKDFIDGQPVALILGDNIFYGEALPRIFNKSVIDNEGATIYLYQVSDPQRYGIAELDPSGGVINLIEKPENPKSNWAITGLYFYDSEVVDIAASLKPSARGEYEITDINLEYLKKGKLKAKKLGRGYVWLDAGTPESLIEASSYVYTLEKRQGLKVACLEEIAIKMNYINDDLARSSIKGYEQSDYGVYILKLLGD